METRTYIDERGRLVLPLIIKKKLNYNSGDKLILRIINNELHVISLDKVLKEAQEALMINEVDKKNMLDEFITLRRKEFSLEEQRDVRIQGSKTDE